MKTLKTALIAASFVAVAGVAANASNEDLLSGFHGNTPSVRTYNGAPYAAVQQDARGAFARSRGANVRSHVQRHEDTPLPDDILND
jgi:hypothetical protein